MGYQYSTQEREQSPTLLPDFETFKADYARRCEGCSMVDLESQATACECEDFESYAWEDCRGWYYAWLDGGLDCWSSDPIGPFATEAEAIAAARADREAGRFEPY